MANSRQSPTTVDILIHGGVLVAMDPASTILYHGALDKRQGRIVRLFTEQFTGRETIAASQQAILPGLINIDHHFLQNFLKGAPNNTTFLDWIDHVFVPRIVLAVQDFLAGEYGLKWHAARLGRIKALRSGMACFVNIEWTGPLEVSRCGSGPFIP